MTLVRDLLAILTGFLVGTLSGGLGVGGGIMLVPILVFGFGLEQHQAQGTSLASVIPTSLVGGFTHFRRRNVLLRASLVMGGVGVFGAAVGAALALSLPKQWLARLFGLFLIFSAFRLWPRAPKPEPQPAPPQE